MNKSFFKPVQLQKNILSALHLQQFELYYQPQFNIKTKTLRGFEALIRWHYKPHIWISPSVFIPAAEKTNAILVLGRWILETAISTLKYWQSCLGFDGIMSVNVSPVQIRKYNFLSDLAYLLDKYHIQKNTLELEITENIFISDIHATVKVLDQIHRMGILISLDDFGTGYASLRYLHFFPLDTLKIDKSFISDLNTGDSIGCAIINAIVSVFSQAGITIIAEGIESEKQLDILKKTDCNCIQGFLGGKPLPEKNCEDVFIKKKPSR